MRLHFVIGLTIGLGLALTGCDTTGLDDPGTCYSCSGGDHTGGGASGGGTTGGGTTGGGTTGGGTSNATFIPVNPRQTYLRTFKDSALDAPAALAEAVPVYELRGRLDRPLTASLREALA